MRIKNRNAAGILCVQIVVIGFWAATTSVLVKRTWFSDESRMAEVAPEKILGMFFAWTEGVDLIILKEGQRIGQMSLSTQEKKGLGGAKEENQQALREISMSGSLEKFSPSGDVAPQGAGLREKEFHWRGLMAVTDDLNFTRGDFVLQMPKAGLSAQIGFDQIRESIKLNVRSGSKVLIDYQGSPVGLKELPELGWLGRLLPLDSLLGGKGVSEGMMKAWAPEISGRYGSAMVAGRRMMVYQLVIRGASSGAQPGSEVKLYLSETGEPLMLDTAWGYQALAAILVPVDIEENSGTSNP